MRRLRSAIVISAVIATVAAAGPATAAGVSDTGNCSGGSSQYALSAAKKGSSLSVKFAVKRSVAGQTWQLFGSDNGIRIFALNKDASSKGIAAVSKLVADLAGSDVIKATAYNSTTGETCSAGLTL